MYVVQQRYDTSIQHVSKIGIASIPKHLTSVLHYGPWIVAIIIDHHDVE